MKILYAYLHFVLCMLLATQSTQGQVKIIFDTDIGGDADDLGALAMLHHFIDTKECDLLAVMIWTQEQYAVPAVKTVNSFYKHSDIPIGVRQGGSYYEPWNYNKPVADLLQHGMIQSDAQDAVLLYRKILAEADDKSIVIVQVGPLANIQNLINSKADEISPLTGKELIEKKVKEFVIMGGKFPSGEWEWNFNGNMPGVTKFVLENLKVPITFSGYEVGVVIKTGEVFNELDKNHPLYVGFMHFSENAAWIKENFTGQILDNATYDQTAVYYAVRSGLNTFWNKSEPGICVADDKGGNTWKSHPKGKHSYLKLLVEPEIVAEEMETLMLNINNNK